MALKFPAMVNLPLFCQSIKRLNSALRSKLPIAMAVLLGVISGSEINCKALDVPPASSLSQERAIQKFPEIGIAGSEANKRFLSAVEEAKKTRPNIFKSNDWPLQIALENESLKSLSKALPTKNSKLIAIEAMSFRTIDKDLEKEVNEIGIRLQKVNSEFEQLTKSWSSIAASANTLRKSAQTNDNYVPFRPSDMSHKLKADEQRRQADELVSRFKESSEKFKGEDEKLRDSLAVILEKKIQNPGISSKKKADPPVEKAEKKPVFLSRAYESAIYNFTTRGPKIHGFQLGATLREFEDVLKKFDQNRFYRNHKE